MVEHSPQILTSEQKATTTTMLLHSVPTDVHVLLQQSNFCFVLSAVWPDHSQISSGHLTH